MGESLSEKMETNKPIREGSSTEMYGSGALFKLVKATIETSRHFKLILNYYANAHRL